MNNILELLSEALKAQEQLKNGKTFLASYVVERFEKVAEANPNDQLVGNMRDVFVKKAKTQPFFSQKEITESYDHLLGLAGGHTSFRDNLSDFLLENRKITEKVSKGSEIRKEEYDNKNLESIYKDTPLSNAFSEFFFGKESSFGLYNKISDNTVEKVVSNQLKSVGCTPSEIKVLNKNEHFSLCAAVYSTNSLKKVSVYIPVQNKDGIVQIPENFIQDEKLVPITRDNIALAIKEQEYKSKDFDSKKFSEQRSLDEMVKAPKKEPAPFLKELVDLENVFVAASNKFSADQIKLASSVLSFELAKMKVPYSNIKIAGSTQSELLFDVFIPTNHGNGVIQVPVEVHNGKPLIPSKFAAIVTENSDQSTFDFNKSGFDKFYMVMSEGTVNVKTARQKDGMNLMGYPELKMTIVEGVSKKDYKSAEDALSIIQDKFGPEKFKVALEEFSTMLKQSSSSIDSKRQELIKEAIRRKELIKIPTTIEYYSPKLGLPLSKIAFDDNGVMIPVSRKIADSQLSEVEITTSKVYLT